VEDAESDRRAQFLSRRLGQAATTLHDICRRQRTGGCKGVRSLEISSRLMVETVVYFQTPAEDWDGESFVGGRPSVSRAVRKGWGVIVNHAIRAAQQEASGFRHEALSCVGHVVWVRLTRVVKDQARGGCVLARICHPGEHLIFRGHVCDAIKGKKVDPRSSARHIVPCGRANVTWMGSPAGTPAAVPSSRSRD